MYFAHFPLEKTARVFREWGGLLGKKLSPPFCNCLREKHKVCIASFQGSNVDFNGAKDKCASFSMTLATFDDAAEVDKIYEVIGESELIFENEFVIFLRDSPVQAATKCGRRPTTSTAAVSSQEFVRQINLAGSNFFESNLLFSFSTFCFYYGLPFKPFRTM